MFRKKSVVISGASKGIGRILSLKFLEQGYEVFGTSRKPSKIQDPIKGVNYVPLDLSDKKSIRDCFEQLPLPDILINNAGQSQFGPVEEVPTDKIRELYEMNLFGTVEFTGLFLPAMRKRGSGKIINIGSLTGRFAIPFQSAYSSSKAAMLSYTHCLRQELKEYGIQVILIEPNDIKTTITPEFICAEQSDYYKKASQVREMIRKRMAKADPPEKVAQEILRVINKKNPKPTYSIGGYAPLLILLKRLLPEKNEERIIRRIYDMKK